MSLPINKPNGFKVVGHVQGHWTSPVETFKVVGAPAITYAQGDVVMAAVGVDANGIRNVTKWNGTSAPLGIVVGIAPVEANKSLQAPVLDLARQFLPAATDGYVLVNIDPFVMFEAQFDGVGTGVPLVKLTNNFTATVTANQTTLSTSAPYSNMVLNSASAAVTATLPVKVIGVVHRDDNDIGPTDPGKFLRVLCKWNTHELTSATGTVGL